MKNLKKEYLVAAALFLVLLCVIVIQGRFLAPGPVITQAEPAAVILEYPETWSVALSGENYTPDMELYINGQELAGYEYTDGGTVAFDVPERFIMGDTAANSAAPVSETTDEILEICLRTRSGKKSNLFQLPVQRQLRPSIASARVIKQTKTFAMVELEVENLPFAYELTVNGIPQTAVAQAEEQTLAVKISLQQFYDASNLAFVITDTASPTVKSPSFSLENESKRDGAAIFESTTDYLKEGYLVAHAFGSYNGRGYTNSLEAFEANYEKGHRIFEVDFQFTADGIVATMHDQAERIESFAAEQKQETLTLLTFEELCDLMRKYPDIYIITDTKYHYNLDATAAVFDDMSEKIEQKDPALYRRIIVQFYAQPMYYLMIENYKFSSYIYNLYASPDTDEQVLDFAAKERIKMVTMWADRATPAFVNSLNALGIGVFAHTVNDPSAITALMDMGVFGVYTDHTAYDALPYGQKERYQEWVDVFAPTAGQKSSGENPLLVNNRNAFMDYLDRLSQDKENYVIAVSAMDEASGQITDDVQEKLKALGLRESLQGKFRYGYAAVLDGGQVIFEECSPEGITKDLVLEDSTLRIESAGYDSGNQSSIVFDGQEYSKKQRGLNIVVYHKRSNAVMESVAFDTCTNYQKTN